MRSIDLLRCCASVVCLLHFHAGLASRFEEAARLAQEQLVAALSLALVARLQAAVDLAENRVILAVFPAARPVLPMARQSTTSRKTQAQFALLET